MVSQHPDPEAKTRILRAAEAEFAARGFDGARVDAIAQRAGVNKALLYYYFQSKAGILDALFQDFFGQVAEARTRVPAPQPGVDWNEFWTALNREVFAVSRQRVDLLRILVLEELKGDPSQDRIVKQWKRQWEASMGDSPGLPLADQAVFNFFFEDLNLVLFQLMNEKWSLALGKDPAESERQFLELYRRQSEAYWSRNVDRTV